VATIGENQQLRRIKLVKVGAGLVVPYMHNAASPNLGKIGVLVALESDAAADVLEPWASRSRCTSPLPSRWR
jgi:elongation factor Ts